MGLGLGKRAARRLWWVRVRVRVRVRVGVGVSVGVRVGVRVRQESCAPSVVG